MQTLPYGHVYVVPQLRPELRRLRVRVTDEQGNAVVGATIEREFLRPHWPRGWMRPFAPPFSARAGITDERGVTAIEVFWRDSYMAHTPIHLHIAAPGHAEDAATATELAGLLRRCIEPAITSTPEDS